MTQSFEAWGELSFATMSTLVSITARSGGTSSLCPFGRAAASCPCHGCRLTEGVSKEVLGPVCYVAEQVHVETLDGRRAVRRLAKVEPAVVHVQWNAFT